MNYGTELEEIWLWIAGIVRISSTCIFSACSNILDIGRHPREYTEALGRNEMAFIETHAVPRMNYHQSSQSKELPEEGMALLKKYIDVTPYLVPSPTNEPESTIVLWHPDLHLDNIFS